MLRRSILAFGLAGWLLLAGTGQAASERGWSAPRVLDPNVAAVRASAVQTAAGQTVAAWAGTTGVFAAVARGDRRFDTPVRLSRDSISDDQAQLLATDRRGDAIVVWQHEYSGNPSPGSLFASYRPAGGSFGPVARVARDTGAAAVAMDGRGDATIAWEQLRGHSRPEAIDVVERRANGRYGRVQQVVRGPVALGGLAVNASDQAVLVWQSGQLPPGALLAAARPAGGTFGPSVQLVSSGVGAIEPQVGLDDAGAARVVWEGPYDGAGSGTPFTNVEAMSLRVGGLEPGAIQPVLTPGLGQLGDPGPLLSVDPHGDALVVWQNLTRDGNTVKIVVARSRAGHPFTVGHAVGTSYPGGNFDATIGPNGDAIVSWESLTQPIHTVIARTISAPFGPATAVGSPREDSAAPAVTIDSGEHATVVWWDLGPARPLTPNTNSQLLYATTP
jgi:hypothetical protein